MQRSRAGVNGGHSISMGGRTRSADTRSRVMPKSPLVAGRESSRPSPEGAALRRAGLAPYVISEVMGIVVEVQLARDPRKRFMWPVYAAALHAKLECATCLVVVAADEEVARWAAEPIGTLQVGSPFAPIVLGPARIPVVTSSRASSSSGRSPRKAIGAKRMGMPVVKLAVRPVVKHAVRLALCSPFLEPAD